MKWPSGRRRPPSGPAPQQAPTQYEIETNTGPLSLYSTEHEALITTLLERAEEESKAVTVGKMFTVTMTDEELGSIPDFKPVATQVLIRSLKYEGLMPNGAHNGTFTFYKVKAPPPSV